MRDEELARRTVLSGDGERRRIERELHDGLQQDLVALAVKLQLARRFAAGNPDATALLDEIRRDLQEALDETRRLAERIYPPLLEAGGLRVALRAAAEQTGVPTEIQVDADAAWPVELAATVHFCFLEVLEVAGDGTTASVAVREEDGSLLFEITTTGAGHVPRSRDRVEVLGGRLAVASGRVSGWLPLP